MMVQVVVPVAINRLTLDKPVAKEHILSYICASQRICVSLLRGRFALLNFFLGQSSQQQFPYFFTASLW
jgi:hypothetical protein